MLEKARQHGATIATHVEVRSIDAKGVTLHDGERISCATVVVATGVDAPRLIPGLPVRPRKGQLAITDRGSALCRRQIVELSYINNAHGHSDESISFNVQPRSTGQMLIGSSRSYGDQTNGVDARMMRIMLEGAVHYIPALADRRILRMWTGFRAATPDSLPIIGPHPMSSSVFIATGHEGLGLTNSLGTAHLIESLLLGTKPEIDPTPFLPARFMSSLREFVP
jgi:glycine/D-amino acid oxidase-like deaminating enzyme